MNSGGGSEGSASPLGDRYKVIRELGRGGFGQTYLAEDLNRFHEPCVVKEFVPNLQDKATLEKAKSLFEQEASVLYRLSHRQIPEFLQLLQVESGQSGRLFLVQEYIKGPTFQQLLQDRHQVGGQFSEIEITQLLYQLLPVLSYIHSLGVIHRDISPENLILRQSDGLPVLIDFGRVKEIAAAVRSQLSIEGVGTSPARIGKVGYIPPEQMSTDKADATSDLYGLAATLLVLANGSDPQNLYDVSTGLWTGFDRLSPKLGAILEKMLAPLPADRFQSADEILATLQGSAPVQDRLSASSPTMGNVGNVDNMGNGVYPPMGASSSPPAADEFPPREAVVYDDSAVIPMAAIGGRPTDPEEVSSTYETGLSESEASVHEPAISDDLIEKRDSRQAVLPLLILLGVFATFLGLALTRSALTGSNRADEPQTEVSERSPARQGAYSVEEAARKEDIRRRREASGIGENTFTRLVDQLFYAEYPNLETSGPNGGRQSLSDAPEDEPLRIRWDNIAMKLLDMFDRDLDQRSLDRLGDYAESDRARWQSQVNEVNVSTRSLYDLTDAKFLSLFPNQAGRDFLQQPLGQVYYAIADSRARAIADGISRESIQFASGTYSKDVGDRLEPGDGKVYTLQLTAGQLLRFNLNAPDDSTRFSIYLPNPSDDNPALIADSEQTTWSGAITQSGLYEIVVVNESDAAIDYQLSVFVDRASSNPPVAPEEEELPAIPGAEEEEDGEDSARESADTDADDSAEDNADSSDDDERE